MEGWVTRQVPDHPEYGFVNQKEAISVEQAIYGFTLGGAESLGYDYHQQIGSIEVGKYADFIVLDQNLLEIEPNQIHETDVLLTVFNGRQVYSYDGPDIKDNEIIDEDFDPCP